MRCEEYEILISAYADGELDGREKADVEIHIDQCGDCRQVYEETVGLQCDLADVLTRCSVVPDLVSAVTAQIQPRPRLRFNWAWAAAVAVVAVCSYALLHSPTGTKPVKDAVILPPSHKTQHQQHKPIIRQRTPENNLEKPGIERAPQPKPKMLVNRVNKPVLPPAHRQEPLAKTIAESSSISVDAAEVVVEYSDGANSAGFSSDLLASPAPQIPIVGVGQRVVAETEIITENGTRTQRICYRIVDSEKGETPNEPSQGE